ncbi:hypothetical protein RRG08_058110 [Elysia crispata]|uniref:Uncharacterized protein n=1 Tax=Elysia crispata TaxID=231223 RepID=A0AAE1D6S2_9GAST|nr:hypothetical protein RRG08_058110 [Elysia crispata]
MLTFCGSSLSSLSRKSEFSMKNGRENVNTMDVYLLPQQGKNRGFRSHKTSGPQNRGFRSHRTLDHENRASVSSQC